ncbi:MAG: aminotransferase class IV family protein [Bacteroidetes bacterium]|nr:aminotransferase class IV family protein [Bacteroidota bacterium]
MQINFNGQLVSEREAVLPATNRAFRYGDGLFESIRVFEGKMPFFGRHWQRLSAGMQVLKMEIPPHFTAVFLQKEISKLTENRGNWRIRLAVWRSGGGLYMPVSNLPEFLIETTPLPSHRFEWNEPGLSIGIYDEAQLSTSPNPSTLQSPNPSTLQSFKTSNALPFVLAAIFRLEKKWDDCLLLNTAGRVACGNSSNVFLVKNGGIVTPPLTEGCVAGTMRSVVLDVANQLKINAVETTVSIDDLHDADEIFLTNAISGIRWVRSLEGSGKNFGAKFGALFLKNINNFTHH